MPTLALGMGLDRVRPMQVFSDVPPGNIIDGNLLLYNEDNDTWYALTPEGDGIWGAAVPAVVQPQPGTPHTVTLPTPQDGTTHVFGVFTNTGGYVLPYTNQANAGGVGEVLVAGAYTIQVYKNPGNVYMGLPVL